MPSESDSHFSQFLSRTAQIFKKASLIANVQPIKALSVDSRLLPEDSFLTPFWALLNYLEPWPPLWYSNQLKHAFMVYIRRLRAFGQQGMLWGLFLFLLVDVDLFLNFSLLISAHLLLVLHYKSPGCPCALKKKMQLSPKQKYEKLGINVPLINVIDDFPPSTHRLGSRCVLHPLEAKPDTVLGAQALLRTGRVGQIIGDSRVNLHASLAPSGRKEVGLVNPTSAPPSLSANHPFGRHEKGRVGSRAGHDFLRSWTPLSERNFLEKGQLWANST